MKQPATMAPGPYMTGAQRVRIGVTALTAAVLVGLAASSAGAAATSIPLGTAGSFVVLAGAGVTNTGSTTLTGDLGTFPTTSETGTSTLTLNGVDHGGDAVTQGAKDDLVTAYDTAAGEGPATVFLTDLGGQTLVAGVYQATSSAGLTGELTLDGGGNADAVFVFQVGSTLTTASASSVTLVNGAQACNVFWQIGSSATLGTGTAFQGNLLAKTDITLTNKVTVVGRVLASDGAVTLDANTVTRPSCALPASPSPSASVSPSTSPAASPTSSTIASSSSSPSTTSVPSPTRTPAAPGSTTGGDGTTSPAAVATLGTQGVHQVTNVPRGGVHAGDGSAATRPAPRLRLALGLLTLLTIGAVAWRRATS